MSVKSQLAHAAFVTTVALALASTAVASPCEHGNITGTFVPLREAEAAFVATGDDVSPGIIHWVFRDLSPGESYTLVLDDGQEESPLGPVPIISLWYRCEDGSVREADGLSSVPCESDLYLFIRFGDVGEGFTFCRI